MANPTPLRSGDIVTNDKARDSSLVTRYALPIILLVFSSLALIYSITTPVFEGPDEIWHYAFADHLANGGGLPVFDVNQPATFLRNGAHPPLYYWLVAAVIAPIDRSDFPDQFYFNLASPKITPGGQSERPNLFIHTAREDFPYHNTTLAVHLARLISIVLSVITIVGVWKAAHLLLPDRDRLVIGATAIVAFVPQFVYGSATVNNDALAAAAATWLVFALLRWLKERTVRWAIISGALLGITLLSKIGMVAILPLPFIALLVSNNYKILQTSSYKKNLRVCVSAWLKSILWKQIVVSGFIIYIIAFAIAGWWYVRNWTLYGDPLAWKQWQVLTGVGRVPPSIGDFIHDMLGLFGTFWVDFSLRVDRTWVWGFAIFALIALGGLIRRAMRRDWPSIDWRGLIIALLWFGLLLASAVRYSFSIYDIHGRLLYPALSTIGVVLILGLSGWKEIVGRRLIFGTIAGFIAINMIVPFSIIQPAYAHPIVAALPDGTTTASIKFNDVELIGYQLKNDRVKSGEPIEVQTYWRSSASNSQSTTALTAIVSLVQPDGTLVDHSDQVLGTDAYPSWAWQPNEIVATKFLIPAESEVTSAADVRLSVRGESAQLILSPAGEAIDLGRIVVQNDRACQIDQSVNATFGGSIKLVGYRIEQSKGVGEPSRVILCWQAIKPTAIDYTVFVHVIDNQDGLITSDAQPLNGNYPTSAWVAGDQIEDSHPLPAVVDLVAKRVSVGLYRLDTGERLTIEGTHETEFVLTTP
jgi:4-amino-4-deoxy-L-arabinose transferase-like glycosyltransferase